MRRHPPILSIRPTVTIDLAGRDALVTGSTQGIGYAIAAGLAAAGARVMVNGRTQERVDQAMAMIEEEVAGANLRGVAADVATAEGAAALHERAPDIDILVNNLGIFDSKPVLEIDDGEWRRYFEVNVLSGIRLTRTYLPGMIENGWGRVLYLCSDSSVVTPVEMVHYGVTKTALLAVSRGFAKAAAGTGVTVNAVLAGPTHTEGAADFVGELVGEDVPWDEAQARFRREYRPQSLLGRLIEPPEVAHLVTYLSSDLASATTGGALRVDGGYIDSVF